MERGYRNRKVREISRRNVRRKERKKGRNKGESKCELERENATVRK